MADVCVLKANKIRLRRNERPESETVQSMIEEEAQRNDLTRFERFKQWTKKKLGGISVVAISVAGIITTIVMGARTVIKKGAQATSKFAKALAKLGEKAAPVIGSMYVCILYLKINCYKQSTLASSTKVGFHEGRRIKKNYLQGIYKKIGVTLVNTKDKH